MSELFHITDKDIDAALCSEDQGSILIYLDQPSAGQCIIVERELNNNDLQIWAYDYPHNAMIEFYARIEKGHTLNFMSDEMKARVLKDVENLKMPAKTEKALLEFLLKGG